MALRLTRSVDSILYGGYYLDPKNLEGSYEHRIWVRRVRDHRKYQDELVNVKSRLGVTEHLISVGGDGINLGSGININIVGIQKFELEGTPYCANTAIEVTVCMIELCLKQGWRYMRPSSTKL